MKFIYVICLMSGLALVQADPNKPDAPETEELAKAVAVATAKLQTTVKSPSDYKLIRIELVLAEGQDVWRATYKLSRLIPRNSEELIGAGGEVFIRVDLDKGLATVLYGE